MSTLEEAVARAMPVAEGRANELMERAYPLIMTKRIDLVSLLAVAYLWGLRDMAEVLVTAKP